MEAACGAAMRHRRMPVASGIIATRRPPAIAALQGFRPARRGPIDLRSGPRG